METARKMHDFGEPGSEFGPGPWEAEPGRVEWYHGDTPCLMRRNRMGVCCGYAAVAPGHPLHGKGYDDAPDFVVHGGLTFASSCDGEEGTGICHVPRPGEPGEVWWFGFDCGHGMDLIPTMAENYWRFPCL